MTPSIQSVKCVPKAGLSDELECAATYISHHVRLFPTGLLNIGNENLAKLLADGVEDGNHALHMSD